MQDPDADVPRKGNVDRNMQVLNCRVPLRLTFPARGTWIEILMSTHAPLSESDVPRKGNVDRNKEVQQDAQTLLKTFPARGTWIEMLI